MYKSFSPVVFNPFALAPPLKVQRWLYVDFTVLRCFVFLSQSKVGVPTHRQEALFLPHYLGESDIRRCSSGYLARHYRTGLG